MNSFKIEEEMQNVEATDTCIYELANKVEIEEFFKIDFNKKLTSFDLFAVFFHENNNHFTLAYKHPRHNQFTCQGWSLYDDRHGCVKEIKDFTVELLILMQTNKIPLVIAYDVNAETD